MTRMAHALAIIFCVIVAAWTASAFARGAAVHVSGYAAIALVIEISLPVKERQKVSC
jgi:low temperature requirement protein LtrA